MFYREEFFSCESRFKESSFLLLDNEKLLKNMMLIRQNYLLWQNNMLKIDSLACYVSNF